MIFPLSKFRLSRVPNSSFMGFSVDFVHDYNLWSAESKKAYFSPFGKKTSLQINFSFRSALAYLSPALAQQEQFYRSTLKSAVKDSLYLGKKATHISSGWSSDSAHLYRSSDAATGWDSDRHPEQCVRIRFPCHLTLMGWCDVLIERSERQAYTDKTRLCL